MNMNQPTLVRLLVAVGLLVAGGSAVDAYLNLNDTFLGEICDATEVDVLQFDALENTGVRIRVLSTGTGTLNPRAVLTDLSTGAVLADVSGGPRAVIEGITLPLTGRYQVDISSADGSVGTYSVTTMGRYPPNLLKFTDTQNVMGGSSFEVSFDALPGFGFGGSIAAGTAGPQFDNPSLVGPNGPIDLSGLVFQMPDLIRFDSLPLGLTALGTFTLKADNIGATGDVKTSVRLRQTLKRSTIVEDDDCN